MTRPLVIRYTPEAADAIRGLHPDVRAAIRRTIRRLAVDPQAASALELDLQGFRSSRVGRYRIVYQVEGRRLVILVVGHRRDVYETAVRLLTRPTQGSS